MEHSKITWEEVIKYTEVQGYGQQIWRQEDNYFFVTEEGGIAPQRIVYELPKVLFELIRDGKKTLGDVHFKLQEGRWPPTEEEKREREKQFIQDSPTSLIDLPETRELFSYSELQKLIPIAEKMWIEWKGKLPDDYVSPLE